MERRGRAQLGPGRKITWGMFKHLRNVRKSTAMVKKHRARSRALKMRKIHKSHVINDFKSKNCQEFDENVCARFKMTVGALKRF